MESGPESRNQVSNSAHSTDTIPHFAKGFLLTRHVPKWKPNHYDRGPDVIDHLWVDPLTPTDYAVDRFGRFVIVLGMAFSIDQGGSASPSQQLLRAYRWSKSSLLRTLDDFVGRYVVLFGSRNHAHVVADPTAMRSIFYLRSGEAVSSHAKLVAASVGASIQRTDTPFRYGFPGNHTPFEGVRVLTANTLLDWRKNQVQRFWPQQTIQSTNVTDVAEKLLSTSIHSLRAAAVGRKVCVALTAGLDSRTLLAVAISSGVPFEVYTYGNNRQTKVDRRVAATLAHRFDLRHTVIETERPHDELSRRLGEANYSDHHSAAVGPLRKWFGSEPSIAVTANLLEIGRDFYKGPRREGLAKPVTPVAMSELHERSMPRAARQAILRYGATRFRTAAVKAFESLVRDTSWDEARKRGIDPFDQFYWEHRMSTWHGPAMAERDYYSDAFIPFNNHRLFSEMLGVPLALRRSGSVQLAAIEAVDSDLLKVPINPKQWPEADSGHRG